jgi:hypothetical protein
MALDPDKIDTLVGKLTQAVERLEHLEMKLRAAGSGSGPGDAVDPTQRGVADAELGRDEAGKFSAGAHAASQKAAQTKSAEHHTAARQAHLTAGEAHGRRNPNAAKEHANAAQAHASGAFMAKSGTPGDAPVKQAALALKHSGNAKKWADTPKPSPFGNRADAAGGYAPIEPHQANFAPEARADAARRKR